MENITDGGTDVALGDDRWWILLPLQVGDELQKNKKNTCSTMRFVVL